MPGRLLSPPARLAGASLMRLQADERLVAMARAGHEAAWAEIVHRYRAPLERSCARIVGPARAEDVVQQAFASAFCALRPEDDHAIDLRPWLYRIAHRAALRQLRASVASSGARLDLAADPRTEDVAEVRDRLRRALAAIDALPGHERDALALHVFEGRSHEEVAAALGLTPGAARQALYRARTTLRAAVTAVTPQPLLLRAAFESAGAGGLGAVAAKLAAGAGVVAMGTGAVLATADAPPASQRATARTAPATPLARTPVLRTAVRPPASSTRRSARAGDRRATRRPASALAFPRPGDVPEHFATSTTDAPQTEPPARDPDPATASEPTDVRERPRRPDPAPAPRRPREPAVADAPADRTPAPEPERDGAPAPAPTRTVADRPPPDATTTAQPVVTRDRSPRG